MSSRSVKTTLSLYGQRAASRFKARVAVRLLVILAALALPQTALAGRAETNSRLRQALAAQQALDYRRVLELARMELADPGVKGDKHKAQMHVIALGALVGIARDQGFDSTTDEGADRHYREGMTAAAADPETLAQLRISMAKYYQATRRSGRALPMIAEELTYQRSQRSIVGELRALDALASVTGDMGDRELARAYRNEVLRIGLAYFGEFGRSNRKPLEWYGFKYQLDNAMLTAVEDGDPAKIAQLWPLTRKILDKYMRPASNSYDQVARWLATAGDHAAGAALLSEARTVLSRERGRLSPDIVAKIEAGFACTDAQLTAYRKGPNAKVAMDGCLEGLRKAGIPYSIGTHLQAGLAYEMAGAWDSAGRMFEAGIALTNDLRGSFTTRERAAFFSSVGTKGPYWGRLRVEARRAAATPADRTAFFRAVAAADDLRARQFGELIGSSQLANAVQYQNFADHLDPQTLVIGMTVMDDRTVVSAFGKDVQRVVTNPVGRMELERIVNGLIAQLSDLGSDPPSLERALKSFSAKLLGEARPLLASYKRVIVIPDGPVALIPATLLYATDDAAEPIGVAGTVTVAPALRLLVRPVRANAKAAGLLAFGDPKYPTTLNVTSLDPTVIRAAGPARGRLRAAPDGSVVFPPLPETRSEVEAIARLFPGAVARIHLGSDATESKVKSADFNQVGYLHIATHGLLGGEIVGLDEPALVLAEEPGQDMLLRASEAQQLKLSGVELTVLSACNTGSGRLTSGEGVMGLSRAFMIAGSSAVLVSLWPVSSKATEEMMVSFYQAHKSGLPVEEALQNAMAKMKAKEPHPMVWAPFVIVRS